MTTLVSGEGPQTASWAVIGEAPGYYEDLEGRPFVGKSGQLLRNTLSRVGLEPAEGYITNVVKHRPPENRTPTTKEIKEALPALSEELAALPNLRSVLLVGAVPLQAVTGITGGITKHRGTAKTLRPEFAFLGESVFITVHPAYVIRNQAKQYNGFLQDLSAFAQLVNPPAERDSVVVVDTPGKWRQMERALLRATTGAIDIETTVDPLFTGERKLVCMAFTVDGDTAYVLPYLHPEAVDPQQDPTFLRRRLQSIDWIMHNGYFDRMNLRRFGLDLKLKHDTMAMAYLLHEEERKGLEVLSSVYLGEPPYKGVDYKNIMEVPLEKITTMNGKDALRTFRLFRPLADELNKNPALSRIYQWLLMPAVNALIEVTENGVPVNRERLVALTLEKEQERMEKLGQLQGNTPTPDPERYPKGWPKHKEAEKNQLFNPSSPDQVGHVLFDHFKLPVVKRTDTGSPSTDEDTLTTLQITAAGEPARWMNWLMSYRKVDKALSSYLYSWPKLIGDDGRLHPTYKPLFVVTGRLSSEEPNIQNVPRDKAFRGIFGGVEGYAWMKADYSQIELRIAAELAREETMLQAYEDGVDLHGLTAQLILGVDDPSVEYRPGFKARDVAKVLNFGLLYGGGWTTLQRTARKDYGVLLTEREARSFRQEFFDRFYRLEGWHRVMEDRIRAEGRSVSPIGRVRHLPDATMRGKDDDSRKKSGAAVREGINHPIQSMASDLLLMSLVRVRERLPKGVQVVAEVHDEIDMLVPIGLEQETAALVKETMEDVSWLAKFGVVLRVPVVAEVTYGGNKSAWSDV